MKTLSEWWRRISGTGQRFNARRPIEKLVPVYQTAKGTVDTVGYIRSAENHGRSIEVQGWFLSFDGVPADDCRVYMDGKALPITQYMHSLESPEGTQEFPDIPSSSHCRFTLTASLTQEVSERIYDSLFFACPMIKGVPGNALACMVLPAGFVLPDQGDVAHIGGNFYVVGLEFIGYLISLAGLRPDHRVLDVGCGVGRLAYPLSRYLSDKGSYEGFDIWDAGIAWAKDNIESANPNFSFRKVDLFNKLYNPSGGTRPSEFVFPYGDGSFDMVFLTSVFTHMYAEDVKHYLKEIARVLRRGGKCLFTCWLLNEESRRLMEEGKSRINFAYDLPECRASEREVPENAIAFEEEMMRNWIARAGFSVVEQRYGYWCGRGRFTSFQDIVVVEKA